MRRKPKLDPETTAAIQGVTDTVRQWNEGRQAMEKGVADTLILVGWDPEMVEFTMGVITGKRQWKF